MSFNITQTGRKWVSGLSSVTAVAAGTVGLFAVSIDDRDHKISDLTAAISEQQWATAAADFKKQQEKIDAVAARLRNGQQAQPLRTSEYTLLAQQIADISDRQKVLESIIMTNPGKAVELPLLRRDIENNKQSSIDGLASIQHSVDRVFDQNKYVMITIMVSIVALAVGTFVKGAK